MTNIILGKTTYDYARPKGSNLTARTHAYFDFFSERKGKDLFQYGRILAGRPGPQTPVYDIGEEIQSCINFSSQDYLSLSSHPAIAEAAIKAVKDYGVHSAGSPMILGNTNLSVLLQKELSEFLNMEHVLLFSTGYAAGFGAIVGLVRSYDYVVLDRLSHASLRQGTFAATSNIEKHTHLDIDDARRVLEDIRAKDSKAGILVVSEGLFSMDSDVPDIRKLQNLCHEFGATLLLDVAHDLGATGLTGQGQLGLQEVLGEVDVVMGSFSKTFASNGGFVATRSPAVYEYLRMYSNSYMFSNALSPVQVAVVRCALSIIRSDEGKNLRADLMSVVKTLRSCLLEHGIQSYGEASPIVPVPIGTEEVSRLVHRDLKKKNLAASIIEFPIVPLGEARFRLQVMAKHTHEQARQAADIIASSIAIFRQKNKVE